MVVVPHLAGRTPTSAAQAARPLAARWKQQRRALQACVKTLAGNAATPDAAGQLAYGSRLPGAKRAAAGAVGSPPVTVRPTEMTDQYSQAAQRRHLRRVLAEKRSAPKVAAVRDMHAVGLASSDLGR